jgi:hypothetical protein
VEGSSLGGVTCFSSSGVGLTNTSST